MPSRETDAAEELAAQREAVDEAAARATAIVQAMYAGKRLTRRQLDEQERPHGGADIPAPGRARGSPMTTIGYAGRQGWARMQPTEAEQGRQVRQALWAFTRRTSTLGAARDKAAVAMVRSQFHATHELFSDAALVAVLWEPQPGACSWDAYRKAEPTAAPTEGLYGLLGSMCSGCRVHFEALEVAERERGLIAAGYGRWSRPSPSSSTRGRR
jgi:hypothetical protein